MSCTINECTGSMQQIQTSVHATYWNECMLNATDWNERTGSTIQIKISVHVVFYKLKWVYRYCAKIEINRIQH